VVRDAGLEHAQAEWPLLLCDDDLPDVLHRLLRLSERLLHDLMVEARQRTSKQEEADASGYGPPTKSLADALESKEFQGAFAKVCCCGL